MGSRRARPTRSTTTRRRPPRTQGSDDSRSGAHATRGPKVSREKSGTTPRSPSVTHRRADRDATKSVDPQNALPPPRRDLAILEHAVPRLQRERRVIRMPNEPAHEHAPLAAFEHTK